MTETKSANEVPTAPEISDNPDNHSGMPHADHIAHQIRTFLNEHTTRGSNERDFSDTRPQHEGQRGGAFRAHIDVTGAPVSDMVAIGALAERNDYGMEVQGDREIVVLTIHKTRHPVYSARMSGAGTSATFRRGF